MKTFNAEMLRLVREQAGCLQSEFRKSFDISQASWSKIETGTIQPAKELLDKISEHFDYPVDFFYQESLPFISGMIFHRKRTSVPAKLRSQIEAEVRLRSLDIEKLYQYDKKKSDILPRDGRTPKQMAQVMRSYWKLGAGPIENLIKVLESHNITVLTFDFQNDKIDGFLVPISDEISVIALNSNKAFAPDRQRMSLAHEFGHLLLHLNDFPEEYTEDEANEFAGEFLVPSETVKEELMPPLTLSRLSDLKKRWKVSMSSLAYRANKLKTIEYKQYQNIMIYLSARGFRKSEPSFGIQYERPILLSQRMKDFVSDVPSALAVLRLTYKRFSERYPEILLEGQSGMAPLIS